MYFKKGLLVQNRTTDSASVSISISIPMSAYIYIIHMCIYIYICLHLFIYVATRCPHYVGTWTPRQGLLACVWWYPLVSFRSTGLHSPAILGTPRCKKRGPMELHGVIQAWIGLFRFYKPTRELQTCWCFLIWSL